MAKETTSARIAKIAARGIKRPEKLTLDEIQQVCASCLTQFEIVKKLKKVVADV